MSGHRPGARANRTTPGVPDLTLDIERVLGLSARQAVRAGFRYDPEHPLVVSVELRVDGGPCVRWRIGRDLLRRGLSARSGLGDVQVRPSERADGTEGAEGTEGADGTDRATAWLRLVSADTAALFELPVAPLAKWLAHTYEAVPAGHELAAVDWDTITTGLLDAR
ncbi:MULTISPECIES: SsgA family sporulation/cell division regulator [unclassified Kitasatospora]|uniref:SsgA family sporulation/cell division regulator n=1 Tax=unclassified Kitasatospora TaxID=2633591 RepID=UPI0033CE3CBA